MEAVKKKYGSFYQAEKELGISRTQLSRWHNDTISMSLDTALLILEKIGLKIIGK